MPVIVLAAGGSTRLGRPKQLVPYRGTTLLRHAVQTALDSRIGPVIVILGAQAGECSAALEGLHVDATEFGEWARGMGSTIAHGVAYATSKHPDARAVILMTCDQPRIPPGHLTALVAAHQDLGKSIAATEYAGIAGIPALFSRGFFGQLQALLGDSGAGGLIRSRPTRVAGVPCPDAAFDVDNPADLETLQAGGS